jgi:hypothetical protein
MRRTATFLCAALSLAAECVAAQTDDTIDLLLHFRDCPLNLYLKTMYERPAKSTDVLINQR